jgi:hypothetical protein
MPLCIAPALWRGIVDAIRRVIVRTRAGGMLGSLYSRCRELSIKRDLTRGITSLALCMMSHSDPALYESAVTQLGRARYRRAFSLRAHHDCRSAPRASIAPSESAHSLNPRVHGPLDLRHVGHHTARCSCLGTLRCAVHLGHLTADLFALIPIRDPRTHHPGSPARAAPPLPIVATALRDDSTTFQQQLFRCAPLMGGAIRQSHS